MTYLLLFCEFFKTGLFAVGGGMATIPFLYDISDKTGWYSHQDLANMIAVSESTPGPIGVNMATYVGFLIGIGENGLPGAISGAVVATLGLVTPSIIVIVIIAAMLKAFRNSKLVSNAFYGLRPASTGLIAAAGLSVLASNLLVIGGTAEHTFSLNWKGLILGILLWILSNKIKSTRKLHPIVFIGLSAVAGIVFSM